MRQKVVFSAWFLFGIVTLAVPSWEIVNHLYPLPPQHQIGHSVNIVSADGTTLRQFSDNRGIFRIPVTVSDVADIYLQTLLIYEDKRFYQHRGVDIRALIRAVGQRLRYGRIISGGSTLTMQVARILYPSGRSYQGKLIQIYRALQLERKYSKTQILNLYLTYAPMGGNIDGVEAASQRYLGKSAKHLNVSEAALLVGIPQRPSLYRPDRYPEQAYLVRNKVLKRLVEHSSILSQEEYQLLQTDPVISGRKPVKRDVPLLARELKRKPTAKQISKTFIDRHLQKDIETTIKRRFQSFSSQLSMATIVLDNQTGKVLAYKGSLDFDDERNFGHVDMTRAVRSPGSTLKPFIYGLALEQGLIHSHSLLLDIPLTFSDYAPQNFDNSFYGAMTASEALQRSRNVAPVYLLEKVGVDNFLDRMNLFDASLRLPEHNLTVALGGGGSTLRELVMYYSSLNRDGVAIKPRFSRANEVQQQQLLSNESAWIIKSILQQIPPPDRATAKFSRPIAWKTGTSFGYRDAWAIGTSADFTVGVWVGRPDGSPYYGQTGSSMAAPILFDIFDLLPKDQRKVAQPEQVDLVKICWPSGLNRQLVPKDKCEQQYDAWAVNGVAPATMRRDKRLTKLHEWPQELKSWRNQKSNSSDHLDILSPKDGSHIYPYEGQKLKLEASSDAVRWYINGTISSQVVSMNALQGKQQIKACNQTMCQQVTITVY